MKKRSISKHFHVSAYDSRFNLQKYTCNCGFETTVKGEFDLHCGFYAGYSYKTPCPSELILHIEERK